MLLDDDKLVEARDYLNTIPTVATEEDEFKIIQNIYIDLLEIGEAYNENFADGSADERGDQYAIVKEIALKENRLSC